MSESFLNGKVTLLRGDCLELLPTLEENSIDSCVTDPPYHLTSIVKRFGKEAESHLSVKADKDLNTILAPAYKRLSKGFMSKQWDGGDIAFQSVVWQHVFRVLKPGAHLIAFGGTRTYHRMACAIEDAGFEIRDQIGWCYGSGFPKSHDISKGIDRMPCRWEENSGGKVWCGTHQTWDCSVFGPPKRQIVGISQSTLRPNRKQQRADAEVYGVYDGDNGATVTAPATEAAIQWQGWGTALKPAWEPIVLARKPLSESSIAANVLRHGTGGINIDGCRVEGEPVPMFATAGGVKFEVGCRDQGVHRTGASSTQGRWPANLIHDGSEEVVRGFPEASKGTMGANHTGKHDNLEYGYGAYERGHGYGDEGSAARFFYTAKADSDDRLGSRHPTVKPLDLIQYLVRLVTPKGGLVLDPFAGTGTAGEAAWREGATALLIEREEEYQADIVRRMGLCLAGPDERARETIKASGLVADAGPLFGGSV